MGRTQRGGWRGDRGAELVEFALLSTAFFLFLFGVMDFGRAIWEYNIVASAARDGARYAILHGSTSSSPASTSDVQTYVLTRTFGLTTSAPGNVTVTTTPAPSTLNSGDTVTVAVTATFAPVTPILPIGTITLHSTAEMVDQR